MTDPALRDSDGSNRPPDFRDHLLRSGHARQERDCFVEFSGLAADQFDWWNVVDRPAVSFRDVEGYDAVVIGGAGAHSVTETYPFTAPLERLVERWPAIDGRSSAPAGGTSSSPRRWAARCVTDLERKELGTYPIELTAAGAADPWLAGLPGRFGVQLGHHDRVTRLPPGGIELARTELCPNQAFRIEGAPIYGAQFHVELDKPRMIARAMVYKRRVPDRPGRARPAGRRPACRRRRPRPSSGASSSGSSPRPPEGGPPGAQESIAAPPLR